jgi:hypothetical protein
MTSRTHAKQLTLLGYTIKDGIIFKPGQVVVAMEFSQSPEDSKPFQAIKRACVANRLTASRADEGVGSPNILLTVLRSIMEAEFLVFDLTRARPNVYYELGYAHGIGARPEEAILVAKSGTYIHADVQPFTILRYDTPRHLEEIMLQQLAALIRRDHVASKRSARRRAA